MGSSSGRKFICNKHIETGWSAEFRHCRDGSVKTVKIDTLKDLKDLPEFVNFAGTIIYRNTISN